MERQGLLNEVLFNPTKRGGHIIFAATHNRKSKIGETFNMGMKADYLTNIVRVIAPGKYIAKLPTVEEGLRIIPFTFCVVQSNRMKPVIKSYPIMKGTQNQTLFEWCNKIKGNYEQKVQTSEVCQFKKTEFYEKRKRIYNVNDIRKIFGLENNPLKNRKTIWYARVSSNYQKEDLIRQIDYLKED